MVRRSRDLADPKPTALGAASADPAMKIVKCQLATLVVFSLERVSHRVSFAEPDCLLPVPGGPVRVRGLGVKVDRPEGGDPGTPGRDLDAEPPDVSSAARGRQERGPGGTPIHACLAANPSGRPPRPVHLLSVHDRLGQYPMAYSIAKGQKPTPVPLYNIGAFGPRVRNGRRRTHEGPPEFSQGPPAHRTPGDPPEGF